MSEFENECKIENEAQDELLCSTSANTEQASPMPKEDEDKDAPVTVVGVSFRNGSKTYFFDPGELTVCARDYVIVETARGLEFARATFGNRTVTKQKIVAPLKKIIRLATPDDIRRNEENREAERRARKIGEEKIEKHKLEMKLVDVEYTFDNQKLMFYFTADGRVDFRELVKDLASVFRTRIELRQIGIRDEAKMIGGLGVCGRPFCCSGFLSDFVQVSIKMAKEQNFSLNSTKISGSCGRLMCCLRYEHEAYEDALKTTPPVGSYVSTAAGNGYVIETRPLTQVIKVKLEDTNENPKLYRCDEVTVLSAGKGKRHKEEPPAPTAESKEGQNGKKRHGHDGKRNVSTEKSNSDAPQK